MKERVSGLSWKTCKEGVKSACKWFEEGLGEEITSMVLNRKKWFIRFETVSGRVFGGNVNGNRLWELNRDKQQLVEVTEELHNNILKLYARQAEEIEQLWIMREQARLEELAEQYNS